MSHHVARAVCLVVLGSAVAAVPAQTPDSVRVPDPVRGAAKAAPVAAVPGVPLLADSVPAGALVFSSWAGRSQVPREFADTHLSLLLTAMNLSAWADEKIPEMLPPEAAGNPAFDSLLDLAKTIVNYAWENTSAVYSLGPGMNEALQPEPHLCFIIQFPDARTADAAERDIQDRISAIIGGESIPNIRFFRSGNRIAFTANDAVDRSPLEALEAPLSADPTFIESVRRNTPGPADSSVTLYLNLERAWTLTDENNFDNPEYERNMKVAGLKHAKSVLLSAGPDGKDWSSRAFVRMDANRTGILGALTTDRKVDPAIYRGIPRSATSVSVISLDLADVLTRLKAEGETYRKGFSQQADAWIGLIGGLLSVNVAELTANFGSDLALFAIPSGENAKADGFDFVLLTRPKDAAKVDQQLFGLSQGIQRMVLTQRRDLPPLNLKRGDPAKGEITTLEVPAPGGSTNLLSPSWVIRDGFLLLSTSSEAITRATGEISKGVLAGSDTFTTAIARLKAPGGASLGFSDLSRTLAPMYSAWDYTLTQAGSKIHPNFKKLPIPSDSDLAPHSTTVVSATWADDSGLHYRSISPYPAAEMFSSTFALVAGRRSLPVVLPQIGAALAGPGAGR